MLCRVVGDPVAADGQSGSKAHGGKLHRVLFIQLVSHFLPLARSHGLSAHSRTGIRAQRERRRWRNSPCRWTEHP